ncbi:hypothetical protein [Actinomadura graeca]|uniref:hypothetical protein n=1 Tax=Actinomadura graeca TaxID=2750812 RepID=UPI001E4F32E6|nr:hypothetical protein [Actinomadura graeca]
MGLTGPGRALPAVVAAALTLTLAADVTVVLSRLPAADRPGDLVSVPDGAAPAPPAVAPLTRRHIPHLLIAGAAPLPAAAVVRASRLRGVAGATVVDAARAQVGGRRVGLLGVDPSSFRAFAPPRTAESDGLWQTIATGGLAVSFDLGRDGSLPLGGVVEAGSSAHPGRVRVGAYASMGIGDVDAVVSRAQARALGLPDGNGLVLSAPRADVARLTGQLRRIMPRGTRVAPLNTRRAPAGTGGGPRVTARPDGGRGAGSPITGNTMTPAMRTALLEINRMFGPFPAIGCHRSDADAQDHGDGRACDFMEGAGGRMPSADARRHGDQVAQYVITNARRLGISYVIWKQHIWNVRGGGWRPMADRGGITQNHFDHVHVSVLR